MFGTKKKYNPEARARVCVVSVTFLNPAAYFQCGAQLRFEAQKPVFVKRKKRHGSLYD
jgi:hypothetical protein